MSRQDEDDGEDAAEHHGVLSCVDAELERPEPASGSDRALQERADDGEDLGDLALGIESRPRVARRTKSPSPSLPMMEATARDVDVGMDRAPAAWALSNTATSCSSKVRSKSVCSAAIAGVARRFGPDFQAELRLGAIAGAVLEMAAAEIAEGSEEIARRRSHRGELLRQSDAVAFAEPGNQRVLGGEVAVEVARAHAGLRRHVLHGRAVEAGARETALGGIEDDPAALERRFLRQGA